MRVAVNGFGSIWMRRFGKDATSRTRFLRDAAFYNTTGVEVGGRCCARARLYGVARFNGSSGFAPHNPGRMRNRVFDCEPPSDWNGETRLLFRALLPRTADPEAYLVVIRDSDVGWIDRQGPWKACDSTVISFSEYAPRQEAMLLMPPFSWVRGANGVFVLRPRRNCLNCADLMLVRGE